MGRDRKRQKMILMRFVNNLQLRIRFGLSHSMAELHGCGDAAKRAARQQIQKEHKLYPGSGTQSKGLDQVKRKQIQRKLDKKIENLTEARKSKSQDKASK